MEKAIIIIFCFGFLVSCSELEEKKASDKSEDKVVTTDHKKPMGFCAEMPTEGLGTFIPVKTVQWMYLDDSLKNICRALNFRLPYMGSDIKSIPEMMTPEILNLSPIKSFEILSKEKVVLNDSISFFHYRLEKGNCHCDVVRIYKGKLSDSRISGYEITEQIVCNAKDELTCCYESKPIEKTKEKEKDSSHYEVHGHEH